MGQRMQHLDDRITEWYDRQSLEVLFLVGVSPLILLAIVLIAAALVWG